MKQNEIITRSKRKKQKQSDGRLLLVPVIRDNNNNDESNENESDITKIAAAGLIAIGIVEKLKPMIQISCNNLGNITLIFIAFIIVVVISDHWN